MSSAVRYVYQIKHKFIKERYGGVRKIEDFAFYPYKEDQDSSDISVLGSIDYAKKNNAELFFAYSLRLARDSFPVRFIIRTLENIYNKANDEEKKEFDTELQFAYKDSSYRLIPTDENYDEYTKASLCFTTNGFLKNVLFLNAADGTEYFFVDDINRVLLGSVGGDIIDKLLDAGVIYKKRLPIELEKKLVG